MGVDDVLFERLCELSTRCKPGGRTLMPGRQTFDIECQVAKLYERALRTHGLEGKRFDCLQDDGFYATLMRKLGLQRDYEVKWAGHETAGETRLDGV